MADIKARTKMIAVRVNPEEQRAFEEAAAIAGRSISDWMRWTALQACAVRPPAKPEPTLVPIDET